MLRDEIDIPLEDDAPHSKITALEIHDILDQIGISKEIWKSNKDVTATNVQP